MESPAEREPQERRIGPTVSKDKWVNHALNKMSRGYVLIVGTTRRNANFYARGKGYEMCAYNVARQLIKDHAVVKTGEHELGEVYELLMAPATTNVRLKQPAPPSTSVDDMDLLLNQLDEETRGDDASDASFD